MLFRNIFYQSLIEIPKHLKREKAPLKHKDRGTMEEEDIDMEEEFDEEAFEDEDFDEEEEETYEDDE